MIDTRYLKEDCMSENSKTLTKGQGSVAAVSLIAIMAMFLVNRGVNIVTPAMNVLYEHFSEYSQDTVAMISTLPNLTLVIGTLLVGAIVGKKVKYRTMAVVGSLLYLVGGVLPYFFDDLWMTLGCRAIFGFGLGLLYPLANALLTGLYDGDKRASMLGYGTLLLNVGGIILQTLGGALADISWEVTFLAHLVAILSLICAFFLPEPRAENVTAAHTGEKKSWLNKEVMTIGIVFLVYMLMAYPVMLQISSIFADRLGEGATVASTAISMYTVLAAVGGAIFGFFFKITKRWVLPTSFLIVAVGLVLVYSGYSYIQITSGISLIGFGFGIIMPALLAWNGMASVPGTSATSTAFVLALMNLGGFICTFYLQALTAIFGESVYSPITVAIPVIIIVFVIFLIFNPYKKYDRAKTSEESA